MSSPAVSPCFHCGEPLGAVAYDAMLGERSERVCCLGCKAVAELIAGAGLAEFYHYREAPAKRPTTPPVAAAWAGYADPEVAARFVQPTARGQRVLLAIEDLSCAACGWLIEHLLRQLPCVLTATVNPATARASVEWQGPPERLADILATIARAGLRPHPLSEAVATVARQQERRTALKRLAVATAGMMQVMMFAVGVYAADLAQEPFDPVLLQYFRLLSLLITTPVLCYAGAPFLLAGWRSLRARVLGMEVPVALALTLAYGASVWNTLAGSRDSEVYFDSVCMFIFFLTLGRYVQMVIRHRTGSVSEALAQQLPGVAHVIHDEIVCDVPLATLQRGDVVLVKRGEIVPADGQLLDDRASVDESLLSGESLPVSKLRGEKLIAGTLNVEQPLRIEVQASGGTTLLAGMVALLERAQSLKPRSLRLADAAAARFLWVVLVGAALTCMAWLWVEPSRAFAATLAVLVAACPCAFAIAAPSALAAASAALARHGVLVTDPDALEALAHVDTMVFDKTGTLTHGRVALRRCVTSDVMSTDECLQIAAALEIASEHPLALAFAAFAGACMASEVSTVAGRGIEGRIGTERYRIGTAQFVAELRGELTERHEPEGSGIWVFLGDTRRELAAIELTDHVRAEAASSLCELRTLGVRAELASGDRTASVSAVAAQCGIEQFVARQTPEQKLAHVKALQANGRHVAMVGDGVNDAPVLGVADVAIAMGRGTALAQASAGIVLVSEHLGALPRAIRTARRMLQVSRQNLWWSAGYNFVALPLAALGFVPPWVAALGMAASSVAVMANATRLLPRRPATDRAAIAREPRIEVTPSAWQESRP